MNTAYNIRTLKDLNFKEKRQLITEQNELMDLILIICETDNMHIDLQYTDELIEECKRLGLMHMIQGITDKMNEIQILN